MYYQYRRLYDRYMNRYKFLAQDDIYSALNKLRNSFLAAKNGEEVDEIINGILTIDEKIKIGRRVLIAELLRSGMTIEEIAQLLNVGKTTISLVSKNLDAHPHCFDLLEQRERKVEHTYKQKKYIRVGGSELIKKQKMYSGFKRKDVQR